MTARSPVAACTCKAGKLSVRSLTMPTTVNHVTMVATNATPAPTATGRH